MPIRSAFYVDGFNLYHGISELNEDFLKWCNLWKLADLLIPSKSETLVKVVYCSAYYPGDSQKWWRHNEYKKALELSGVTTVWGHYVHEPMNCKGCNRRWEKPTEKQGDINVALHLFNDAVNGVFDKCYLVSADSDQAATAKMMKNAFPDKPLVSVAPPNRDFSNNVLEYASGKIALNLDHIEKSLLPPIVLDGSGQKPAARRPNEYTPPDWWVHPDDRPTKK
ncbi:NYN domain-containing protein [Tepidamorphus sp. 3E244]|uniref:NYN domain-containing protein n=1 Tax=Tepidamorphus sp. 3E244 TaxID=3385498 RepID=UPI0038FCD3AF